MYCAYNGLNLRSVLHYRLHAYKPPRALKLKEISYRVSEIWRTARDERMVSDDVKRVELAGCSLDIGLIVLIPLTNRLQNPLQASYR